MFMIQPTSLSISSNGSVTLPDIKDAEYLEISGFTSGGGYRGTVTIPSAADSYFYFLSASGAVARCTYHSDTKSISNESTYTVYIYRVFGIK